MATMDDKIVREEEYSYRSDEESAVQRDWTQEEERRAKRKYASHALPASPAMN